MERMNCTNLFLCHVFQQKKLKVFQCGQFTGKTKMAYAFPLNWINPILSKTYWISKAKQYHQANILLLDMENEFSLSRMVIYRQHKRYYL